VDDEERILRSLRLMFAQQYNVRITTSGREALDMLRQAREVSPNTMRLLLTGYSDMEAVMGSINEGEIFRYISKPWNPADIRTTIGSVVEIAIGLDSAATDAAGADEGAATERILVIDADPEVASQIKSLLDEQWPGRHKVEWASDVESVFRILERTEVALVISDVRLGDTDVSELLKSLKRHNPHVVALVLTHYQDSATLVGLINQAQIHRFLLKPVRRNLTLRGIESGLERYRTCKAAPQLAQRHQVEASSSPADTPVARRILDFFKDFGRKAN
jgi:DNA-binding NtrC family response regulator